MKWVNFILLFFIIMKLSSQNICIDSSQIWEDLSYICLTNNKIDNKYVNIKPVCGCDSVTYINKECALLSNGVLETTAGGCNCIDSTYIAHPYIEIPEYYEPVCGCDGKTYFNKYYALFKYGITRWTDGPCSCIAPELIDTTVDCSIEPRSAIVCGCDTINYKNGCEALYHYGVASFTEGPCPCIIPDSIDTSIICSEEYDPVCGCDTITYKNACIAKNHYGIYKYSNGECVCIDSSLIAPEKILESVFNSFYDPVCGCDSITYFNKYFARYGFGIFKYTPGACKCVDTTIIDTTVECFDLLLPVIGCDGNLYQSPCIAKNYFGVLEFTYIDCQSDLLIDSTIDCHNNLDYFPVCGCDSVTYHNPCAAKYYGGLTQYQYGPCPKDSCIDKTLIDSLQTCLDFYDPVCGCDSITYTNECVAKYKYGVKKWSPGTCTSGLFSEDQINRKTPVLFPNPVRDKLNIYLPGSNSFKKIVISDVYGKDVLNLILPAGLLDHTFDIGRLPSGIYIISFIDKNINYSEKIIKL